MDIEQFDFLEYFGQYGYDKNRNFVPFYGNHGQDLFGNFWILPKKISYAGIKANNLETLYHAAKFSDLTLSPSRRLIAWSDLIKKQFNNLLPLAAFYLSRKYKNDIRPDWHNVKDNVMLDLLRIKFKKPLYALVLLSTGSRYLVEHTPVKGRDNYWSDDHDGSGQNKLGKLLMVVRSELFGTGIVAKPNDYLQWVS